MNKQKLIRKYEDACFAVVPVDEVLEDLKKLDEPQKPVVPQFVADYIEFKKEQNFHVYGAMRVIEDHYDKRVPDWFYEGNIETFVRAWIDGYTVEKEKRYLVKMKGISGDQCYLNCINNNDKTKEWILYDELEYPNIITKHTRKDLEDAGFGWVFDCPGIEIEEEKE